jgi:magnesium-transporting ATPase (P-type)
MAFQMTALEGVSEDKTEELQPELLHGLTSEKAAELLERWGANEVPVVEKSMCALLLEQFVGTMPFILEVCIVISASVQDWADFAVILVM